MITTVISLGIPWSSAKYKFQLAPLNKMTTCLVTFFIRIILNILFLVDLPLNSRSFKYRRLFHMCKRLLLAASVVERSNCSPSSCPVFCFQGSKVQTRVGLLMLLCTWISNCPIAVTHFLHNQENVPFVSFKKLAASAKTPCTLAWSPRRSHDTVIKSALTLWPVQLTAQISENLGEDERLVQGLCALLLGICIYYNDNSLENYTK